MGNTIHTNDVLSDSSARQIDAPTMPRTKKIYELWKEKGAGGIPKKQDMDASTVKELMPYIYIINIHDNGADFSMRFMGSAIVQSVGMDYTGIKASENKTPKSSWRTAVYKMVYESRKPVFTRVPLSDFKRDHIITECALLPLANRHGEFNMILCCATPL